MLRDRMAGAQDLVRPEELEARVAGSRWPRGVMWGPGAEAVWLCGPQEAVWLSS